MDFQNSIQYVGLGYNGKFVSFVHSIDINPRIIVQQVNSNSPSTAAGDRRAIPDIEVQARSCYIVSNTNVGISFTQLTSDSIVSSLNGPLPDNTNIFANIGYGLTSQYFSFQNYLSNAASPEYLALTYEIASKIVSISPTYNFSSQLYTNPLSGGAFLDSFNYADTFNAMGKARMPHINVLYVQVNEAKPINLL
jgi:hypothetical protein